MDTLSAGNHWATETATPQAQYRYLLCDLLTDRVVATPPLEGVTFEQRISRTGACSAQLMAVTPEQVDRARVVHERVGRSALYVLRNHQLWWGGVLWTSRAQQGPRGAVTLRLQAATFDSYAHHRRLRETLRYTQVDQARIVAGLWDHMQSDPRGDIGVDTSTVADTGVLRDREYLAADLHEYGELIEQLGDVDGGPEHMVEVFLDGTGRRSKRLRVANRIGNITPTVTFTRARRAGGRVQSWDHTADAVDSGTTFQTRGDSPSGNVGNDKAPLLSTVHEASQLLDSGWPLLDRVEDHTGVRDVPTLNEYAAGLREAFSGPLRDHTYTVHVGGSDWSPARLGDNVRLKLSDLWHRPAVDVVARPVACKVTAADRSGDESVKLIFGEV